MKWKEMIVHTSNEAVEAISNILNEAGANGVVIQDPSDLIKEKRSRFGEVFSLDSHNYPKEGVYIKAYFVKNSEWSAKCNHIKDSINKLEAFGIDIGANQITINTVKEENWENEWKKYFKPVKVTNHFVIVPSWENYTKKDKEEMLIYIDPGMAFGTGTHPTTILSLLALEETVQPNDIVLDIGSGSGILSIASVLLGAKHVYSYDLDEIAVKSTKINRNINHLEEKITVKQNNLLKHQIQEANIIVSNILAEILVDLIDDAWNNLEQNGYFITSGIIKSKEKMIKDQIEKRGFHVIKTFNRENWVSLIAKK